MTYGDITSPPFVNRVQSTFCQSSPVHLLSIESSPPFVNRVQSTFCQSSPVHLLSIESSPLVQSTFCQSSPVHLLSIESSPPFVNRVQSTFCQSSPVHVLSYARTDANRRTLTTPFQHQANHSNFRVINSQWRALFCIDHDTPNGALQSLFWQNFPHFDYIKQIDNVLPARGPLFCSYHIMTSYRVSITEQTTAKCYLCIGYKPKKEVVS